MATNLALDDKLIEQARAAGGHRTKKEAVTSALQEYIALSTEHFVQAAEFSNRCRKKGLQGSTTDFLICAVAASEHLRILTSDSDFLRYAEHLPIRVCGTTP